MTDQLDVSGGAPGAAGDTAGGERPPQFGLPAAMALIVGSVIGVGIFNLPTSLAFYGPITLVSMALTTAGALVLALLFASLSRRLPADGGPYAYARAAFGNRLGVAKQGPVLRGGQCDVRRHLGRQRDGRGGHHLRLRRAERLDHDQRRDAAGRCQRRPVPAAVQAHLQEWGARFRHRDLRPAVVGRGSRQLSRL